MPFSVLRAHFLCNFGLQKGPNGPHFEPPRVQIEGCLVHMNGICSSSLAQLSVARRRAHIHRHERTHMYTIGMKNHAFDFPAIRGRRHGAEGL